MITRLIISIILLSSFILHAASGDYREILERIYEQSTAYRHSESHVQHRNEKPARDYQVGDSEVFWSWMLNVMPPVWIQVESTCRAVGEHCYIFVADDQWDVHMDQDDIDIILPYLEDQTMNSDEYGAIEMDIETFGPIPDELDNDPRLIVFYSELGSFMGTMFDGYFSAYNQVTEEEAQNMDPPGHSNECEMIYMTCHPLNPTDPIRISVLSHELQHLIHWGGDINEDTWVNEGCSELAMVLFGLPDPIIDFPQQTDNSLIIWDQQFADYVKVMLFYTYFYEHYDNGDLIHDLVFESQNGINGIENQLDQHDIDKTFAEIFTDWTIANYLDDPEFDGGIYNYLNLDLPLFHSVSLHSSYPDGGSGTVSGWAAEYVKFFPEDNTSWFDLDFTSNNPVDLSLISFHPDYTVNELLTYPGLTSGSFMIEDFSNADCSYIVMAVSNSSYSSVSYEYDAEVDYTEVSGQQLQALPVINSYPNPFRISHGNLRIEIDLKGREAEDVRLEIFNLKGQMVKEFPDLQTGSISWDGLTGAGMKIASGIYYYRISTGVGQYYRSFVVIR